MTGMTIDIVSDVVCPWCYLGKRRLEAALEKLGQTDAVVRWRPFQLDETIPEAGMDRETYMRRKFGDLSRIAAVHERLQSYGAEVGAAFDFAAISRAPNTLAAHRLSRWAQEAGCENAVVDRLFRAYFELGEDVGDIETLVAIAAEGGMDGDAVRRRLLAGDDLQAAQTEIEAWKRAGVTGVPFFIFDGRLGVSGAQSVDVLASAMVEAMGRPATAEA